MSSIAHPAREKQGERIKDLDTRAELIQALIPLAAEHVRELLEEEVQALAGTCHACKVATGGYVRWGEQPGSAYLADQKIPVRVPRVRHYQRNQEIPLAAYQALQKPRGQDEGVLRRIPYGLSCRNYSYCAEAVPEAFGLSGSTISRRYVRATPPQADANSVNAAWKAPTSCP